MMTTLEDIEIQFRTGNFQAAFTEAKSLLSNPPDSNNPGNAPDDKDNIKHVVVDLETKMSAFLWLQKALNRHFTISEAKEKLATENEYLTLWATLKAQQQNDQQDSQQAGFSVHTLPEEILLNQ